MVDFVFSLDLLFVGFQDWSHKIPGLEFVKYEFLTLPEITGYDLDINKNEVDDKIDTENKRHEKLKL